MSSVRQNLDDPATTVEHGLRIRNKGLLRKLYAENYELFRQRLSTCPLGIVLELGSGGGFLKEVIPDAVTSDVLPVAGCDLILSAEELPFADGSVRAIVMQDVLHHIKNVEEFFIEANRCLAVGGKVLAIEPSSTPWARFIWKNFHHEPYDPHSDWKIPASGPLSGANGALPWIVFSRDRQIFEQKFDTLKVCEVTDHTPFMYLLSGGVRTWSLLPGALYSPVRAVERGIAKLGLHMGMFLFIELQRIA